LLLFAALATFFWRVARSCCALIARLFRSLAVAFLMRSGHTLIARTFRSLSVSSRCCCGCLCCACVVLALLSRSCFLQRWGIDDRVRATFLLNIQIS
jgi:hypothetical protein